MPLSMFADPAAATAVEPPSQAEFDAIDDYLTAQAVLSDPFGQGMSAVIDNAEAHAPASSDSSSWLDVFGGIGKSFASAFGSTLGQSVGGGTSAQRLASQQANANTQIYWVVGGVGVAVVLGALLLRGKR